MIKDLLYLFYPVYCPACNRPLWRHEKGICMSCFYNLPRTHYHVFRDNPLEQLFWGRVKLANASAYFFFQRPSIFQEIIHSLKYNGNKAVGEFLGKQLAEENRSLFADADLVMPVPLHPKKLKTRGYNQSEIIARSIAETLNIPLCTDALIRTWHSESQTKKGKTDRWLNVEDAFQLADSSRITNKKILLVDDVITTGATIEACAKVLEPYTKKPMYVAALAYAKN